MAMPNVTQPDLGRTRPRISVIVCAYNEERYLGACLSSLIEQQRPPDEIVVVDNASTDATRRVADAMPRVSVVTEAARGLVRARERGRLTARGEILAFLDADCRAPAHWLARVEQRLEGRRGVVAVTGPYRFYDWDWRGRLLLRAYDHVVAPATHLLAQDILGWGAVLYGGNFAVRRDALDAIGGFDTSIEFHGEDTNIARRLSRIGRIVIARECWMYTSARRYAAMGKARVFRLYVRNFWSEIVHHRPRDTTHLDVRR